MKNAVVTKTEVVVVEDQLPAGYDLNELEADAAQNPRLSSGDVALPYISVLQTNSPQVNPAKANYIPGAQAGMFFNTVLEELYEGRQQGLIVIPCAYERRLVEWVDREKGGGWVGDHPLESDILKHTKLNEKGKPTLPNGNLVIETGYHYCLFKGPEDLGWSQGVIAMASTHLKANRKWNQLIASSKIPGTEKEAPRYLYGYQLTTAVQSKGENSWFVPDMRKVESPINLELYRLAKKFATAVNSGLVSRVPEAQTSETTDPETGEVTTKTVPF